MGRPKKTEYSGVLAKPIDTGLIMPLDGLDSPQFKQYLEDDAAALDEARRAKLFALYGHFGFQLWPGFDQTNPNDVGKVWAVIAMSLAVAHVPGFRRAPQPRHLFQTREVIRMTLSVADWQKANGRAQSDLPACLEIVQGLDPELKRPGRKTLAMKQARTLRNKVSQMRQALKRERAASEAKRITPLGKVTQLRGSNRLH